MRLQNVTFPTRQIFERSASFKFLTRDAPGVAPHALTIVASYTVPAGRAVYLSYSMAFARRASAPTTSGLIVESIYILDAVGNKGRLLIWQAPLPNVNDNRLELATHGIYLTEGYKIEIATEDLSSGGTVDYRIAVHFTEFQI
jgi:hypothetical protein